MPFTMSPGWTCRAVPAGAKLVPVTSTYPPGETSLTGGTLPPPPATVEMLGCVVGKIVKLSVNTSCPFSLTFTVQTPGIVAGAAPAIWKGLSGKQWSPAVETAGQEPPSPP